MALEPDRRFVYKPASGADLGIDAFFPEGWPSGCRAAIAFFFGGGWVKGSPTQFHPHCRRLAERGMAAFSADYRVESRHGTSPFACVADGKSAMRWLRGHADKLGIDPGRLAAGGGSAGGHVAAAVLVEGFEEAGEDQGISCRPDALVLFNPVIDNGPGGYGNDRVGGRWEAFSPLHNIRGGAPPALFQLGTSDRIVPVETAERFRDLMGAAGARCDLVLYEGEPHGFFNYGRPSYEPTALEMERFLESLGYFERREKKASVGGQG